MTETSATQGKDTIRESEVAVAFDRLAGMRNRFLGTVGKKTGQRERKRRVIDERLQRAQPQRLPGVFDGSIVRTANTSRQRIEAENGSGVGIDHHCAIDGREREIVVAG